MSNPFNPFDFSRLPKDLGGLDLSKLPTELGGLLDQVSPLLPPGLLDGLKNSATDKSETPKAEKTSAPKKEKETPVAPADTDKASTSESYKDADNNSVYELNFAGFTPDSIEVSFTPATRKLLVVATKTTPVFSSERVVLDLDAMVVADDIKTEYEAGLVRVTVAPSKLESVKIPLTIVG